MSLQKVVDTLTKLKLILPSIMHSELDEAIELTTVALERQRRRNKDRKRRLKERTPHEGAQA